MKYFSIFFVLIWVKYFFSKYSRYRHLFKKILDCKPVSILEIGVYRGKRSVEMIKLANEINNNKTLYYGFDLFENISSIKIYKEASKKPLKLELLKKKIEKINSKKRTHLIKGDTIKSLKTFSKKKKIIDFIFIDGGHSLKTIKSDWNNIKKLINKKSEVVFDDYYHDDSLSQKFGCKKLIDNLSKKYVVDILQSNDHAIVDTKKIKNSLVSVKLR